MEPTPYGEGEIQHVRIAEIRVAAHGILKATLGSCVAIAVINRKSGRCALAHCLLPWAPAESESHDARFVDRVIPNLMRELGVEKPYRRGIEAFIAGGARMIPEKNLGRASVGELNLAAAKNTLEEHHIRFQVMEGGGTAGCNIILDCEALTVECHRIATREAKTRHD